MHVLIMQEQLAERGSLLSLLRRHESGLPYSQVSPTFHMALYQSLLALQLFYFLFSVSFLSSVSSPCVPDLDFIYIQHKSVRSTGAAIGKADCECHGLPARQGFGAQVN